MVANIKQMVKRQIVQTGEEDMVGTGVERHEMRKGKPFLRLDVYVREEAA